MEINNKLKYPNKTITYIFIGSLLPGISIANPAEKENFYHKKIELVEIEVKDNVSKTYLKKRTSAATKTDTRIRDIPQSISVVTEEQIKDQSILGLTDAIKYSPGVMAGQGEGNRDSVWFRGNQSTSDLFVDGVRDDVQYYRDLYNIDRVEVLMGPNGMIFGRGGVGGVINRVSKEANWETKNEFRVQGGAYEHKRSSIDFNQAITNSLAIRVNGMIEDSGSFRHGVESERKAINPTFTFKPSDKTKIIVGMEYFNDKRTSDRGIPSVANGLQSYAYATNRSTFFGNASQSPNEAIVKNGYAIIEHAFDNGFSVKNHTRFSDYDKYYQNVYANSQVRLDGTVTIDGYYDNTQRQNFFNQTDLTYNLKTGSISHRLLAGLEIGFQENQNYRIVNNGTDPTPLASNPYALLTWQSTKSRNTATDIYNQAVYFQDQISLNEQYQIIAGIRYDQFKTKFNDQVIVANSANVNDQFLSPRVGLVYKPIEPVSIYTNYSLSYLPRTGEQLTSLTSSIKSFDPEKISNIEVGLKYDLLQSFSISSAIYRLQRSNMTITDPSNSSNTIIVDGQVTKGFELGVAGKLFDTYSMYGGYTYQDAEITKTQGTGGAGNPLIISGTSLGHVPKHTFSLWNKYEFNETWSAALGIISRSDMYAATPTSSIAVNLPGYTRLDAAIFANINKQTKLQLNIENLLDKTYYQSAHNNNNIMYGYPLTARATLTYTF